MERVGSIFFDIVLMICDAARDYTNVGGDEYKYYLFALRDAEKHFIHSNPTIRGS